MNNSMMDEMLGIVKNKKHPIITKRKIGLDRIAKKKHE